MQCLLYARVSTDKQAEKDLSIPAQLQLMREYAQKQGWSVIDHFIDEGESARTADRPELKRLLKHCQKRKGVDVVLVHKMDRLARNLEDYTVIRTILRRHGIRLVSVSEHFDEGPSGQLMENIIASIAEYYSANLGEEVKKAAYAKLQRGEWPHQPPIGYRSVRDEEKKVRHVEDEARAPLVRRAFELYGTGEHSLTSVTEEMADQGLRTSRGKPFSEQMMKNLLTRRFYIGRIVWKGQEYQGRHTPLIDPVLFYRVDEILQARHADTGEKGRLHFLLRGTAYCRTCGQRLTAERHPRGTYYRCLGASDCGEPYVPVQLLEDQLEDLYLRLQPPENILGLVKREIESAVDAREKAAAKEVSKLKRLTASVEAKELKLVDELVSGAVARDHYNKLSKRYADERLGAQGRLAKLQVNFDDPLDFFEKCTVVASTASYLHQKFQDRERKMLVRALFQRIEVREREIVGATLKPPFDLLMGDGVGRVFKDPPHGGTLKDIFEQLIAFTLSSEYDEMKALVDALISGTAVPDTQRRLAA